MTADPTPEPSPVLEPLPPPESGGEMTIMEHLKELRNRVVVSAVALLVTTILCFVFWQTILGWLLAPARESHPGFSLKTFGPTESIGILFKIGLYGGLMLASPVFVYELLAFIVPGLTTRERKVILPALLGSAFFLLAGMAFAYWVILPASLGFLLDFGNEQLEVIPDAQKYMDFAIRIIFWVGVAFELPMVMGLLGWLGVVSARQMLSFWRYGIVIVFIIAAIVTPTPDPYNQALVAGPLLFLYLVGILLAWIVRRRPPKAAT